MVPEVVKCQLNGNFKNIIPKLTQRSNWGIFEIGLLTLIINLSIKEINTNESKITRAIEKVIKVGMWAYVCIRARQAP